VVRQQPGLRRLPVVVLTSSNQSADIDRAYDLGANSYLVKPVQAAAFLDVFRLIARYWAELNQGPLLHA
jgi:CheY-like chemotaxis protein